MVYGGAKRSGEQLLILYHGAGEEGRVLGAYRSVRGVTLNVGALIPTKGTGRVARQPTRGQKIRMYRFEFFCGIISPVPCFSCCTLADL